MSLTDKSSSEPLTELPKLVHVTLDPNLRIWKRRPRTKKRRILMKWKRRPENWVPDMRPWTRSFIAGRDAATILRNAVHSYRMMLIMHPLLWAQMCIDYPTFTMRCDVVDREGRPIPPPTNRWYGKSVFNDPSIAWRK